MARKLVVELLFTLWAVAGERAPLLPAEGVTVQLWMAAEQLAVVPPLVPLQIQLHGPDPVTVDAAPVKQRFVVGIDDAVMPFALPQTPFTGTAATLHPLLPVTHALSELPFLTALIR